MVTFVLASVFLSALFAVAYEMGYKRAISDNTKKVKE